MFHSFKHLITDNHLAIGGWERHKENQVRKQGAVVLHFTSAEKVKSSCLSDGSLVLYILKILYSYN